ncbi:unnamed protein product [Nezara viridula]|uniref:Uncharacterized protein n=1 Tax=Nezara viridula TaxID=85310 RepID=A0A9P0MS05_NEZVI|nr:unnamed protein product [Nezara viridula]
MKKTCGGAAWKRVALERKEWKRMGQNTMVESKQNTKMALMHCRPTGWLVKYSPAQHGLLLVDKDFEDEQTLKKKYSMLLSYLLLLVPEDCHVVSVFPLPADGEREQQLYPFHASSRQDLLQDYDQRRNFS